MTFYRSAGPGHCIRTPRGLPLSGEGQEGRDFPPTALVKGGSEAGDGRAPAPQSLPSIEGDVWTGDPPMDTSPPAPPRYLARTLQAGGLVQTSPTQVTHGGGKGRCQQEHRDKGDVYIGALTLACSQATTPTRRTQELTIPKRRAPGPAHGWHGAHKPSPHTGFLGASHLRVNRWPKIISHPTGKLLIQSGQSKQKNKDLKGNTHHAGKRGRSPVN